MITSTPVSREDIFAALFAKLQAATFATSIMGQTTWRGSARKYVDPDQVGSEQPFLSQFEGSPEIYEQLGTRLPPIRTLSVRLYCWARVESGAAIQLGSQYVTTMLEAVEQALKPDDSGYGFPGLQTLGGRVQWCRIEGTILKFPGDTEPQAMVSIPVRMLWP